MRSILQFVRRIAEYIAPGYRARVFLSDGPSTAHRSGEVNRSPKDIARMLPRPRRASRRQDMPRRRQAGCGPAKQHTTLESSLSLPIALPPAVPDVGGGLSICHCKLRAGFARRGRGGDDDTG
jgi:hypothetical protein